MLTTPCVPILGGTPGVPVLGGAVPPLRALSTNLQPAEQVC